MNVFEQVMQLSVIELVDLSVLPCSVAPWYRSRFQERQNLKSLGAHKGHPQCPNFWHVSNTEQNQG